MHYIEAKKLECTRKYFINAPSGQLFAEIAATFNKVVMYLLRIIN